ncbi:MAG TPA: transporter substrate-binding domain-containing protein [Patescibacteria group bacterium]|nr:transporter substrate-binding domain-containing protein [Patescibacteria group bacterium]
MKHRRITWLPIIVAALCFIGTTSCQQEQDAWDRIQESGILRVGLDPTYPPFEVLAADGVAGIDVDLAQAIAKDLGLRVEFTYFGYDGLYDALATNQVDVLASALVISIDKFRDFAYTTSYFNAGQVLVSRTDFPHKDPASLVGSTLAVELGAQGHVEAAIWERQIHELEIMPFASTTEALEALSRGDADAALVDHIGALVHRDQDSSLVIGPDLVTEEPFALVVLAGQEELLDVLNESLVKMSEDNQLQIILDRWLGK